MDLKAMEEYLQRKKESYTNYYAKAPAGAVLEDARETEAEQEAEALDDTEDDE